MNNLTVSRHHHGLKVISSDGKTWTVELNFGRYQILSASNRRIKAAGPTGKRIVAAVDEFFTDCAEKLPAALDAFAAAVADPEGGKGDRGQSPREKASQRAIELGAGYYELAAARRRGEAARAA